MVVCQPVVVGATTGRNWEKARIRSLLRSVVGPRPGYLVVTNPFAASTTFAVVMPKCS